jgi:hypothetical protein
MLQRPDFEYRLYDGAPAGTSVLHLAMTLVNPLLEGLKIRSGARLKDQLEQHIDTLDWSGLGTFGEQAEQTVHNAVAGLDPELVLERVHEFLGSGSFTHNYVDYKVRLYLDGDWEVLFSDHTFGLVPGTETPIDSQSDLIRFRANLARIALRDFGIDVRYWNAAANNFEGAWLRLAKIDLVDDSKVTGIHAAVSLGIVAGQEVLQLLQTDVERFRPITFGLKGLGMSYDNVDIDLGGDVSDWILDKVKELLNRIYSGLNFYEAIANKLMERAEKEIRAAVPETLPAILHFPHEVVYGRGFERPAAEQLAFRYRPEIEIVGAAAQRARAIHFRHKQRKWILPPEIGGGGLGDILDDLFDPDRFTILDRIKDLISIYDILGSNALDIRVPIPRPDLSGLSRDAIAKAVNTLREGPFRARDESALQLLKDGLSFDALGALRWTEVDLEKRQLTGAAARARRGVALSAQSVRALQEWRRLQTAPGPRGRDRGRAAKGGFVFTAFGAEPLGPRALATLWLTYQAAIDLGSRLPDIDIDELYEHSPPLPGIRQDVPAAIAYAVNSVVPNVQLGFLHAYGGLNLSAGGLPTAEFETIYPPMAGLNQAFSIRTLTPPQAPVVDFVSQAIPRMTLSALPVELVLAGASEQPLVASLDLTAGLTFEFLQCPACVQGKEEVFLDLLGNLVCLGSLGLIQLTGDVVPILQCLLHAHPIALAPDGSIAVHGLNVQATGTFPPGAIAPGSAEEQQLKALLSSTLPRVFAGMVRPPVLFDLFHLIPQSIRDTSAPATAGQGWMMLMQPLGLTSG